MPDTYTLAQLQDLRKSWLADNATFVKDCLTVAVEFGEAVDMGTAHSIYHVFKFDYDAGTVSIFARNEEKLNLEYSRFDPLWKVMVVIGDITQADRMFLVNVRDAEFPGENENDVFVPGKWMGELQPFIDTAKKDAQIRSANLHGKEIAELSKLLLIGEAI